MRISVSTGNSDGMAAAATASAVAAGQMLGTALVGSPAAVGTALVVFAAVFAGGLVSKRRERDAGLRFACDAISAIGAAATFYAVPGLLVF